MDEYDKEVVFIICVIVGILAMLALLAALIERTSCESRWEHSGLQTEWGVFSGCVVQMPSGRWLPEDTIRDIDINTEAK